MPSTTLTSIISLSLLLLSTSATPAVYPRSREVSSSAKTGMAWPNGNANSISQYYNSSSKVSWYYTWSPNPISDDALEFVPMLWGADQADSFASTIQNTISTKTVHAVLGMNEPNLDSQSSLKPEDAAGIWKSHIQPLKGQGLRLGSPAVTSAPDGKTWYQSFFGACDGCTIDFLALHYYGTNATQLIDYITDMHNTFQLPVWITEFACQSFTDQPQCTYESTIQFMHDTQSFMDQTEWVERYSWFGAMENLQGVNPDNALLDKQGKITPLGDQYIGVASSGDSQPGNPVTASKGHAVRPVLQALIFVILLQIVL